MLTIARSAVSGMRSFFRSDRGQDVFEYVLIIGILTVAILVAVATPLGQNMIQAVVEGTCNALNAVSDAANGGGTGNGFLQASCNFFP